MNERSDREGIVARPRRPLLGLAASFVLGMAAAPVLPDAHWPVLAGVAAVLLAAAAPLRRRLIGLLPLFGAALVCGTLHGALARPGVAPCNLLNAMERDAEYLRLAGRIVDAPVRTAALRGGEEWRFTMDADALNRTGEDWRRTRGRLRVRIAATPGLPEPRYGDRIALAGSVRRAAGPDGALRMTAVPASFQRRSPGGTAVRHTALAFRSQAARSLGMGIEEHYPRETAIVRALTLGMREHIPEDTRENFLLTGTMHIFAISGLHVGIVAAFGLALLRALGVPRRWQAAGLAPLLVLYVAATGLASSAVRAAVMALAYTAAPMFGRRPDIRSAFALAAIAILVADAGQIRDVGFLYSFVVVGGLLGYGPALTAPIRRGLAADHWAPAPPPRLVRWTRSAAGAVALLAAASLAAWLASAPLQAHFANRVAPSALLGNLLAVPSAFLIVLTGGLSLVLNAISASAAEVLNHANRVFASELADLMAGIAALPGAHWNVTAPSGPLLLLLYAAPAGLFALRGRPRRVLAAATATVVLAAAVQYRLDRRIRVHALSEDFGSAVLIEGPSVATVLADAGPRHRISMLISYLRARGINRIEALILTRADADAVGGATEIARRFAVTRVYIPAATSARSSVFTAVAGELRARGIPIEPLGRGDRRMLPDGAEIEAFHPDPAVRYSRAAEAAIAARWGRGGAAVLFGLAGSAAAPLAALESADADPVAPLAIVGLRGASAEGAVATPRWRIESEDRLRGAARPWGIIFQGPRADTREAARARDARVRRFDANEGTAVRAVLGGPPGTESNPPGISAAVWAGPE